jgi:hypothetical protein
MKYIEIYLDVIDTVWSVEMVYAGLICLVISDESRAGDISRRWSRAR